MGQNGMQLGRPLRELTESNLLREGVLEFVNGLDFREGTRVKAGKVIAVGGPRAEMTALRILSRPEPGADAGSPTAADRGRVVSDPLGLEADRWEAREV